MADPATQLERFRAAVDMLGGQRPAARLLDRNERTIRALYAGTRELHDGWLADLAQVMVERARQLRELERQINPAFAENLTDKQALAPRHGNRFDMRKEES